MSGTDRSGAETSSLRADKGICTATDRTEGFVIVYSTGEENRVADVEHIPWVERELMVMREVRELQ